MKDEVVVTRKGQTTIPARLRAKYGMEEGARLIVVDTGDGVVRPMGPATSQQGS